MSRYQKILLGLSILLKVSLDTREKGLRIMKSLKRVLKEFLENVVFGDILDENPPNYR